MVNSILKEALMSHPITHAVFLGRPPVSLDFPEDGGVSVTVPEPPNVSVPESNDPSVTIPEVTTDPSICIGQDADGGFNVSIPPGLSVSIPLNVVEGISINDAPTRLPSQRPARYIIRFPSGGNIIVPRLVKGSQIKINGVGISMDPLP